MGRSSESLRRKWIRISRDVHMYLPFKAKLLAERASGSNDADIDSLVVESFGKKVSQRERTDYYSTEDRLKTYARSKNASQ